MRKILWLLAFAALCLQSTCSTAVAEDWTRFRGINGTGVSDSTKLPTTWNDTENIAWKIDLPGYGSSCPIVTGDRIFVTCYSGYGIGREGSANQLVRHLICVDGKQGTVLWDRTVSANEQEDPYQGYISEHGYASNSATTDGTHVFAFHGKVIDQSIYVFGGFRSAGSYRIRSGGKGDITKSHVDWYSRESSYVATPVHHEGRLY